MMGRPPVWTEDKKAEAVERICQALSTEEIGLDRLCKGDPTLPDPVTFRRWLQEDEDIRTKYVQAREAQADLSASEIIYIADTETDPNRARVRIDARKWSASKLAPKVYGDRLHVDGGLGLKIPDDQLESRIADLFRKAGVGATSGGTGET